MIALFTLQIVFIVSVALITFCDICLVLSCIACLHVTFVIWFATCCYFGLLIALFWFGICVNFFCYMFNSKILALSF